MVTVPTRVFSGDVVASGENIGTTASTIFPESHPLYDPDGIYSFMIWTDTDGAETLSHEFRLSDITHNREMMFTNLSTDRAELNVVAGTGLRAEIGGSAAASNKWLLIRLA